MGGSLLSFSLSSLLSPLALPLIPSFLPFLPLLLGFPFFFFFFLSSSFLLFNQSRFVAFVISLPSLFLPSSFPLPSFFSFPLLSPSPFPFHSTLNTFVQSRVPKEFDLSKRRFGSTKEGESKESKESLDYKIPLVESHPQFIHF